MINDTYNNLGISLIALLSMVRQYEETSFSEMLLVNPILLHNETTTYLKNSNTKPKSINDLIISKIDLFTDFNSRFYSFLELSINTISIAEKMNFISFNDNKIIPNKVEIDKLNFIENNIGTRAYKIVVASKKLYSIFEKDMTEALYLKLRIEV